MACDHYIKTILQPTISCKVYVSGSRISPTLVPLSIFIIMISYPVWQFNYHSLYTNKQRISTSLIMGSLKVTLCGMKVPNLHVMGCTSVANMNIGSSLEYIMCHLNYALSPWNNICTKREYWQSHITVYEVTGWHFEPLILIVRTQAASSYSCIL